MKRKRRILLIVLLGVLLGGQHLVAQTGSRVQSELNRLRNQLRQAEALVQWIRNPEIRQEMQQRLKQAFLEYQKARRFYDQGKWRLAFIHIRAAYDILRRLQGVLKDQPFLKFKFKEQLDRRIQDAERRLQGVDDPQALRMLNRAKFFRRRANLVFRQQRPLQALEFLRLALFFADNAIRLASKGPAGKETDFQSLYARAEELFQRLQRLAAQEESEQGMRFLDKLERQIRDARQLFENQKPHQAMGKLRVALHSMYRWIDQMDDQVDQQQRLQEEYRRFLGAFRRQEQQQHSREDRVKTILLQRLRVLVAEMEGHLQRREWRAAREKLRTANRLLYRLAQRKEEPQDNRLEVIRQQLELTRNAVQQLKADIALTPDTQPLFQLIDDYFRKSQEHLEKGQMVPASIFLNLSNQLITKLYQLNMLREEEGIDRRQVWAEIERLEQLLARLQRHPSERPGQQAARSTAQRLLAAARKAYENGRLLQAREMVRFALNLLTR